MTWLRVRLERGAVIVDHVMDALIREAVQPAASSTWRNARATAYNDLARLRADGRIECDGGADGAAGIPSLIVRRVLA